MKGLSSSDLVDCFQGVVVDQVSHFHHLVFTHYLLGLHTYILQLHIFLMLAAACEWCFEYMLEHTYYFYCHMNQNHSNNKKILTSGIIIVLPCIENYSKVDLRTTAIDIPPQEVCLLTVYVISIVADKFRDWKSEWFIFHNLTILNCIGWFREIKLGVST